MKWLAIVLAAVLLAGNAAAAEYGMGLSAKSDNGLLYFPIDVTPGFRVEPHVRYVNSHSDALGVIPPGFVAEVRSETESLEVGVGLFGLSLPKESVRIYYGARIGYEDIESKRTITAGQSTIRDSSSGDGYSIAPTLGFEYLFNRHFTLGAEVAYYYRHSESESTFESGASDLEAERTGTESFIILRYFF